MANLALCIPFDKWEEVLREVSRILVVGGRLELINDHIFFPSSKSSSREDGTPSTAPVPQADVTIHSAQSSSLSRSVMAQSVWKEPTAGRLETQISSPITRDISNQFMAGHVPPRPLASHYRSQGIPVARDLGSAGVAHSRHPWTQQAASCQDLEDLYERMLTERFGIHARPSEFIAGLMRTVFHHVQEVADLHLTLAPATPTHRTSDSNIDGRRNGPQDSSSPITPRASDFTQSMAVNNPNTQNPYSSGLILWPSTFIPISPAEAEMHGLKNLRVLLSCRDALVDYARGELKGSIDGDAMLEALWDYER